VTQNEQPFKIKGQGFPFFITYSGPNGNRSEGFWTRSAYEKELKKKAGRVLGHGARG
jgi:hypothetical protein